MIFNKDRAKYSGAEELPPGWHSSMASGHAISVLTRAYRSTNRQQYLDAANDALELYKTLSVDGGFLARFMESNEFPW